MSSSRSGGSSIVGENLQPSQQVADATTGTTAYPATSARASGFDGGGISLWQTAVAISKTPNQAAPQKAVPITMPGHAARLPTKLVTTAPFMSRPLPSPVAPALLAAAAAVFVACATFAALVA